MGGLAVSHGGNPLSVLAMKVGDAEPSRLVRAGVDLSLATGTQVLF